MKISENIMRINENLSKIYSGRMYQTSVRPPIHSTASNVSDFRQTSDAFDQMYETSVKSDENLMKIIENPWKSMKILWKSDENLWQHHSSNERRVGNSPHNLQSTTAALNGAWEIPRKIYEDLRYIQPRRMYQTFVRLLIHSTKCMRLPSNLMKILWKP